MQLYFACKRIPINQILKCSFGLTSSELETLKILLKKKESSVEEVANKMNKDRTTVQRAIKSLMNKGLCKRRQYNLDGGGYQYYYSSITKEEIKKRISDNFNNFSEMILSKIESW